MEAGRQCSPPICTSWTSALPIRGELAAPPGHLPRPMRLRPELHLDRALAPSVRELVDDRVAAVQKRAGRAVPDDAAAMDHRGRVTDPARARHIVRDRDRGRTEAL